MNKRVRKSYDKAMIYYEKGKINKALELCEDMLLEGLDNPEVLNFKGLLLYQKGSLNEAVTTWKINRDLNNDEIAKNYINDSVADEKRLHLFRQGEQALKQLKVDKALGIFNACAESDFNSIKVNTGIGMCYQKKGDFYRAKEYVDKALSIDRNAITAKVIEKELKENGVYSQSKSSSKGLLIGTTALFVIIVIAFGSYIISSKIKNESLTKNTEETKSHETIEEENSEMNEGKVSTANEPSEVNSGTASNQIDADSLKNASFNKEKLEILMSNSDLDGVFEQLKNVKVEDISNEDTEVYNKAIKLMKNDGVAKFYELALWHFNQGSYSTARISFDKAYTYCEGNSLKEHILFYRASNSLKEDNKQMSLEQFEEYYKQYPKGVYTQEALYQLALLSKNVDKEKSKVYANALINNFPGSIYINDNIVSIIRS